MSDDVEKKLTKFVQVSKDDGEIRVTIGPDLTTDEVLGLFLSGLVHSISSQFVSVGEKQILQALNSTEKPVAKSPLLEDLTKLINSHSHS